MTVEDRVRTALLAEADSLREPILLSASGVRVRAEGRRKRRRLVVGTGIAILAVGFALLATTLDDPSQPAVGPVDLDNAKTPDEILDDRVVTQKEWDQAGQAVVQCLAEQGADGEVTPDGFGFSVISDHDDPGAILNDCIGTYMGVSVQRVWADQNHDPVAEFLFYSSVVECTSKATGIEYGELTQDQWGYASTDTKRTINKALAESPDEYDQCFDQVINR